MNIFNKIKHEPQNWPLYSRLLYKLYRKLYRDPLRRKIRKGILNWQAAPVAAREGEYEVHMLLCRNDFEMGIISAMLFDLMSNKAHFFCFHEDGSLTEEHLTILRTKFPGCRTVSKPEADQKTNEVLKHYPEIKKWRTTQVVAQKVIDFFVFHEAPRLMSLDPDVLFLSKPDELLKQLQAGSTANVFNRDISTSYGVDKDDLEELVGLSLPGAINVGLYVQNRTALNLDELEKWMSSDLFQKNIGKWTLEQGIVTSMAVLDSQTLHFSKEYDVAYEKDIEKVPVKHYVGKIRHWYELEGLLYLLREKSLEREWTKFTQTL